MDDVLKEALEAFRMSEERERDNRASFEEDVKFARLEEQWPEEIARKRAQEGRPMHTVNKLAPVIRQVVNDARQNKPSITCGDWLCQLRASLAIHGKSRWVISFLLTGLGMVQPYRIAALILPRL